MFLQPLPDLKRLDASAKYYLNSKMLLHGLNRGGGFSFNFDFDLYFSAGEMRRLLCYYY